MKKEFENAFQAWLASESSHIKRKASRKFYRVIWSSFARDLPIGVTVSGITSEMVAGYLLNGATKSWPQERMRRVQAS